MEIFILPWDQSYRAGRGRWTRWDTCPGTLLACTVWTSGQWRLDSPARTSWWWETPCCPPSSSHSRRCSSENTHTWWRSQHDTSMNLFQAACPWNGHCSCWLCEDNLNGLEGKRRVTQADAHFFSLSTEKRVMAVIRSVSSLPFALHLFVLLFYRHNTFHTGAFLSVSLN